MKTFLRLLAFSKPYYRFVPGYATSALLAVVFGVVNFALLVPLLKVIFDNREITAMPIYPQFRLSLNYFTDIFYYYLNFIVTRFGKQNALIFIACVIFASVLLTNIFRYISQRILTSMRVRLVEKMRNTLFSKLMNLPLAVINRRKKGDLMSRITNDIQEVETSVVSSYQVIFREPLLIVGYFFMLFSISVKLTFFTILLLPVSGFLISSITRKLRKKSNESQKYIGSLTTMIEESLSGLRVIKGYNLERYGTGKFRRENASYSKLIKSIVNKREMASPLSEFLGVTVAAGILVYGGNLVLSGGGMTAEQFIAYIIIYSQVLPPAKSISNALAAIQKGIAAGKRVFELTDLPSEVRRTPQSQDIHELQKGLEFRNVSFAYEEEFVLKNINFNLKKGKTIALVGPSGGGKSTIADLIPRFYDPTSGDILIDGEPLKSYSVDSIRNLVGIVSQETVLFNDTIFNNIALGIPNASQEEVERAAKIAHAHEFIIQTEQSYNTFIGDRGNRLSGGQRQRLSIARAVLRNPQILILDEATSALDSESERLVQEALENLLKDRTSVVIAHRLSTIRHADEILVIQHGEIVQRGTHNDLILLDGLYKKLTDMQTFS